MIIIRDLYDVGIIQCHITPNRRRRFDRCSPKYSVYSVPFAVLARHCPERFSINIVHHVRKPSTASVRRVRSLSIRSCRIVPLVNTYYYYTNVYFAPVVSRARIQRHWRRWTRGRVRERNTSECNDRFFLDVSTMDCNDNWRRFD